VGQSLTDRGAYSLWRSRLGTGAPSRVTARDVYMQVPPPRGSRAHAACVWVSAMDRGRRRAMLNLNRRLHVGALRQQSLNHLRVAVFSLRGEEERRPSELRRSLAGKHGSQHALHPSSQGPRAFQHHHTPRVALRPGPCLPPLTRLPPDPRPQRARASPPPPTDPLSS
jgi:hypothetical protein